jgi:glycosyltransferase involved in cell wall biosynthesis
MSAGGAVRVAFVSSHAQPGGSERYLELLLEGLGRDWVAGVVSLQAGDLVDRLRAAGHGVSVVKTGARLGVLSGALRLRAEMKALRPQVVHANGIKAALVAGLAVRGTRIPVVWVKHDFSFDHSRLVPLTAVLCREIVGVSAAVTEAIPPRLRARVHVVPNGLPPLGADAVRGRQRLVALGGSGRHVLLLGRLNRVKGALELVEAAPGVLTAVPDARFTLVGGEDPTEPDYAAEVRAAIARLGLGDAVFLTGLQEQALDLLAAAAVVAVPSGPNGPGLRGEGFGLVALEAMVVGTPVVGYAAGGLPEVVGDCGLLVVPGDRQALGAAIATALTDERLRARLASCGPQRVRGRFALDATVEAMRRRYRAAAAGTP